MMLILRCSAKARWLQTLVILIILLTFHVLLVGASDDDDQEEAGWETGDPFPESANDDDDQGLVSTMSTLPTTTSASAPTGAVVVGPGNAKQGQGVYSPDCQVIADLFQATGPWRFTPELTNCCNTNYPNSGGIKCNANHQIIYIYLAGQGLLGQLPESLGSLTALRYLILSYNQLVGPIPASLTRLPLYILDLSHNQLLGNLPSAPGWSELEVLNLQANKLSGRLPDYLFTLPRLRSLALGENQWTTVEQAQQNGQPKVRFTLDPATMDQATMEATAQLDPATWPAAPSRFLARFAMLPRLAELKLDGLGIEGGWPTAEAWQMAGQNWTKLDLSRNVLQGRLPDGLGRWTRLKTLLLDRNEFGGPIPDLSALKSLRVLNLSFNQLSGPIPPWAAGLNMTVLNLSYNLLSGTFPLDNHHPWQSCSAAGNYFVCTQGPEAVLNYRWRSHCRATCTDTQQPVPLVRPPVDPRLQDIKGHGSKSGAGRVLVMWTTLLVAPMAFLFL